MSQSPLMESIRMVCFPRVSGDEPVDADPRLGLSVFSPRERG